MEIDPKFLKFGICNFESDKYIAIRDEVNGEGQLTVIELEKNNVTKKPNKSEGALMHPSENIIALKAKATTGNGHVLQIFNMATRKKLVDLTYPENIIYWKWVTD